LPASSRAAKQRPQPPQALRVAHADDSAQDHVQRHRLHRREDRKRIAGRPASDLGRRDLVDERGVPRDRLAVERRQEQAPHAQVPIVIEQQHRAASDDRQHPRVRLPRVDDGPVAAEERAYRVGITDHDDLADPDEPHSQRAPEAGPEVVLEPAVPDQCEHRLDRRGPAQSRREPSGSG